LSDDPMVTFFSHDATVISALRNAFRDDDLAVPHPAVAPRGDRVISAMAMACVLARNVCLTEPQSRVFSALEARAHAMLGAPACAYASIRRARLRQRLPRLHGFLFSRRPKLRKVHASEIFVRIEQTDAAPREK